MKNTPQERLRALIENMGLSVNRFEIACGLSNGSVSKVGQQISTKMLEKIQAQYPNVNRDWLLTGNGEMLVAEEPVTTEEVVMVPLYNLDARGGFGTNEVLEPEYVDTLMPFSCSMARPGDIAIHVYGNSMYPKYPNGTILLIRQLETWYEYVELGAAYVIETTDGQRYLKNVCGAEREGFFLLKSINPEFDPSEMPKTLIRHMFRVVASLERSII